MVRVLKVSRIVCAVPAALGPRVLEVLEELGIPETLVQGARFLALDERTGPFGLGARTELAPTRAEIFRFHVPRDREGAVASRLVGALGLRSPGRGSLWAEDTELFRREDEASGGPLAGAEPLQSARLDALAPASLASLDFTVLCCIVQRGLGDAVARTILEMGLCVPVVSFGRGMGLRNRLGLLRVTIPVEKEILHLAVPRADAALVADIASRKARLDLPGRGFIYRSQVRAWAVDARIRLGGRRSVASIEQIIGALDELRGSAEWRHAVHHAAEPEAAPAGGQLACVTLTSDEGRTADFVRAAMDSGAGGATLVRMGYREPGRERAPGISHARESCDLIVEEELARPLLDLFAMEGLFAAEAYGLAEIGRVERALTWTG